MGQIQYVAPQDRMTTRAAAALGSTIYFLYGVSYFVIQECLEAQNFLLMDPLLAQCIEQV